jgi:hypothetical protein
MGLLRLFLELNILVPAWLLVELGLPILRDRPKFPVSRWLVRKLLKLIPSHTSVDFLVTSAEGRRRSAKLRLEAAARDREAAELENRANKLEIETNQLRTEGDLDEGK